jgi:hypothetical protein
MDGLTRIGRRRTKNAMKTPQSKKNGMVGPSAREARLAEALRQNLKRRKAPKPAPTPADKPSD